MQAADIYKRRFSYQAGLLKYNAKQQKVFNRMVFDIKISDVTSRYDAHWVDASTKLNLDAGGEIWPQNFPFLTRY